MSIQNNIWETAEAYLAGTLPDSDIKELQQRLASDKEYAAEFHETTNLIRSMEGNGRQKRFRSMLRDIQAEQQSKKGRTVHLPAHFWRTAAVAAGVALLTSTLTYSFLNPSIRKNDFQYNKISREVDVIRESQRQLNQNQRQLERDLKRLNPPPAAHVRFTGTGFAINNDGYFVTSNHVVDGADSIYIQDRNGDYFKAVKVAADPASDLAVLKIAKKNFHFGKGEVPYTFAPGKTGLGADIFTLGYPKNDLVYSTGAISSRNGFEGNDLQYTLELPVGHGQSGSPVFDDKGNVIGILTAIGGDAEANTYAVSSKALVDLLHNKVAGAPVKMTKTNKLRNLSRQQQIEKLEAFTFSVKVYKK
jgi:S1-C subfamily serine protease